MTVDLALLADPTWFPLDYDPGRDAFALHRVEREQLSAASFLDERLQVSRENPCWLSTTAIPAIANAPALLFHTAFCGSTLLARALDAAPAAVALREPSALLSLATASLDRSRYPVAWIAHRVDAALSLLARPWIDGGRVLIKPTNQVNRLLPVLLASNREPAILLYSSLEEFLLSCCKKLPEAETRIRWMAQFLLPDTQLAARLGVARDYPFNFVESCVLTWYSQIERYALALAADRDDRLRSLDMASLLAAPTAAVAASAHWLQLPAALDGLEQRVQANFSRDAKRTERAFDPSQREREKTLLREHYGPLIASALRWAEASIAPAAMLPSAWKPLSLA